MRVGAETIDAGSGQP